ITIVAGSAQLIPQRLEDREFLLSFANASNIDLTQALRDKMRRNAKKYPVEVYKGKY
ncbi:MAG: hypothetical protein GXW89_12905, partial [Phycisphaerae bacterium]|nr:hypothetical protein [Phycisphaerae bacterium]